MKITYKEEDHTVAIEHVEFGSVISYEDGELWIVVNGPAVDKAVPIVNLETGNHRELNFGVRVEVVDRVELVVTP